MILTFALAAAAAGQPVEVTLWERDGSRAVGAGRAVLEDKPRLQHEPPYHGAVEFAEVVLNLPVRRGLHFRIPDALRGRVVPGARVEVPFGPRTQEETCVRLHERCPLELTRWARKAAARKVPRSRLERLALERPGGTFTAARRAIGELKERVPLRGGAEPAVDVDPVECA